MLFPLHRTSQQGYLRGLAQPGTTSRNRGTAFDGRWIRFRRRRRLENGSACTSHEIHESWSDRWDVVHGKLYLSFERWRSGTRRAHAGSMSIACRRKAEIHPLSIGGKADPVRLVFTASSGTAMNASVVDLGDRFRLIVNQVNLVSPERQLTR